MANFFQTFTVLLFVFFSIFIHNTSAQQRWSSTWSDECKDGDCYGGVLQTCVDGSKIYGKYSDIGYIVGTISGNKASGSWYEAGMSVYNYGGFDWTIQVGGISGTWWYEDSKCLRNSWITPLLNTTEQVPINCDEIILEIQGSTIEGDWVSESGFTLSFCKEVSGYFVGSGDIGTQVFIAGQLWENDQVATANYWTDTYSALNNGIMLLYVSQNGSLIVNYWEVAINSAAIGQQANNISYSIIFTRDSNNVSNTTCQNNSNLNQLTWGGVFTDEEYGGYFYICQTGADEVQGVFSDIGFISGTIVNDTIEGHYFTAGDSSSDRGNFQLTLENNGLTFQGLFISSTQSYQNTWRGERLDSSSAYLSDRCYIVPENNASTLIGQWYYGKEAGDTFDICLIGESFVEVSYSYNGGKINGYGSGYITSDHKSMQLAWNEKNTKGVSFYRLISENRLIESFWANVDSSDQISFDICDDDKLDIDYWGLHHVNRLILLSSVPNPTACARNRNKDLYSSSSDANSIFIHHSFPLKCNIASIIIIIIVAFLFSFL